MSIAGQYLDDISRWAAVRNKDLAAESAFVYCVKTTKIYCRPTCKARLARRANISFYDTADEAEMAGFRACKRCQPQLDHFIPDSDINIARICMTLDDLPFDAPLPRLEELAADAGLTKFHFHRSFKKATGMTPREYVLANRRTKIPGVSSGPREHLPYSNSRLSTDVATPALTDHSATWSNSPAVFDPWDLLSGLGNDWVDGQHDNISLFNECDMASVLRTTDACELVAAKCSAIPETEDWFSSAEPVSIYHSCAETMHGKLLVAFQGNKIVKLELASTAHDFTMSLQRAFPSPFYICISTYQAAEIERLDYHRQIQTVVEALERPSGKTLDVQSLPTFEDGGYLRCPA